MRDTLDARRNVVPMPAVASTVFRTALGQRPGEDTADNRQASHKSRLEAFNCNPYFPSARPRIDISFLAHHGGRAHEVPPSQSVIRTSRSPSPKPRHIAVQARNDHNDMAQGQGSTETGREAGYIGQEEYRGDAAEGTPDILRTFDHAAVPFAY